MSTNEQNAIVLPVQKPLLRRIGSYPAMEHYYRLVILVCIANFSVLFYGMTSGNWFSPHGIALTTLSNLVVINLTIAVLIRQQYTVNFLFWLATRAPTTMPLSIRWHLGKIYHHGGLHSGCAMAATAWFIVFTSALVYSIKHDLAIISVHTQGITYAILGLLLLIIILAMPNIRGRYHNTFERVHRFGGWSTLILFWAQTFTLAMDLHPQQSIMPVLTSSFSFWALIVVTFSILLPWLRLRRVPVHIETPSNHVALLTFDYGVTPFAGSSMAISRNPLIEWHQFANVPSPNTTGYRLTVSRAGDWTGKLIDDKPSHLWVKGIPTAGVANIEVLFKRVVYIATGSGIGPCIPHLLANKVPIKLVWSTRSPRKTYGDKLVDEILTAQPDALIWDTTEKGKPDMVKLAYAAYKEFGAEAVICIANQKLTQQVVYGLESRGIPAYGAIWDS
jgi:hypothetical protein